MIFLRSSVMVVLWFGFFLYGNPNEEFRATWVITWDHISSSSTAEENKARIREIMDDHAEANMTSVLFQVRQSGTAYYNSSFEPWGYRNVWYRFRLDEADIIVPVTLNSMAILKSTFMNCYLSQKNASFPSYELDGPFCNLSQKIWVEQHQDLQLLLGRDYWYQNENPHLRAVHGAIYLKEMNVDEFLDSARELEETMEGNLSQER